AKAYSNCTSPLGAAMLMERLFTDSLVSCEKQAFIQKALGECATGKDRIAAPLIGKEGVSLAHKTGSGYTKEGGILVAHNDVGYICLPAGVHYTLAVFVKDFQGNEAQAAQAIARISERVYSMIISSFRD
ncbi:MAG: class A beta-lactamase-related serine hydrolase, partial [Phocaeicola sp.]|nr:class A beta-lactamase-related serine hydrolase [Phocaeicola sp.]